MNTIRVAHMRQNGAELIIVPIAADFGQMSAADKQKTIGHLQTLASRAGVSGVVVPVWDAGHGKMGFIAPRPWHPFFHRINLRLVAAGLNREIDLDS